jgi:hypothetical protein
VVVKRNICLVGRDCVIVKYTKYVNCSYFLIVSTNIVDKTIVIIHISHIRIIINMFRSLAKINTIPIINNINASIHSGKNNIVRFINIKNNQTNI